MPASSDNLYKLILETASEGVWMFDENYNTTFVNDRMTDMISYSREEMVGKSIFQFIDEKIAKSTKKKLEKSKQGFGDLYELSLISKSGGIVWTLMNSSPIILDGEYKGVLAMVTDISERKRKDEVLKENYLKYMSLFEESPVPIWYEDFSRIKQYIEYLRQKGVNDFERYFEENPDEITKCASLMIVNDVNKAVVAMNEANSKEHVLEHFRDLVTKDSTGYAIKELIAIANNEHSCEFEAQLKTFKGNKRHVHLKWSVVKGHEDTYKHVYLTTTDWTEKIIDHNLELQKSNREKVTLLKEIHHRVKNNLQIISSLLNLQAGYIDDEETKEIFYVTLNRVHSMALVHELLYSSNNFSSIDYAKYLEALLERMVDLTSDPQNPYTFKIDVEKIELNINTALPLGLLINEIVTNSIKHGLKGIKGGKIYVEIKSLGNGRYLLNIGDNGHGMKEEVVRENQNSLGMQLIDSLTDQLSGELTMDNSKKGTHYSIEFSELP